jgi:hypothetical protein
MSALWDKTQAEAIATDLLQFTVWQSMGLSTVEIATRMHITVGLAERYERAIADLMNDLNDRTAPDAPEAVPDPPKEIRHVQP